MTSITENEPKKELSDQHHEESKEAHKKYKYLGYKDLSQAYLNEIGRIKKQARYSDSITDEGLKKMLKKLFEDYLIMEKQYHVNIPRDEGGKPLGPLRIEHNKEETHVVDLDKMNHHDHKHRFYKELRDKAKKLIEKYHPSAGLKKLRALFKETNWRGKEKDVTYGHQHDPNHKGGKKRRSKKRKSRRSHKKRKSRRSHKKRKSRRSHKKRKSRRSHKKRKSRRRRRTKRRR